MEKRNVVGYRIIIIRNIVISVSCMVNVKVSNRHITKVKYVDYEYLIYSTVLRKSRRFPASVVKAYLIHTFNRFGINPKFNEETVYKNIVDNIHKQIKQ